MFAVRLSSRSTLLFTKEALRCFSTTVSQQQVSLKNWLLKNIFTNIFAFIFKSVTSSGLIKTVHKNISLKHCGIMSSLNGRRGSAVAAVKQNDNELSHQLPSGNPRPLAVLFTWLAAREKHIEKYRNLWFQKGFDVLTVKMDPHQLLLPKYGSIPLIQDVVRFLYSVSSVYPDFILHCFSVGAYQFGEMFSQLHDQEFMKTIRKESKDDRDPKTAIEKAIKGIIFDSAVNLDGVAQGVSRAMTDNPVLCKSLEMAIKGHMVVSHPVATKYYERASEYAHGNYLTDAPGLLVVSEKDRIGAPFMSQKLMQQWKNNGISVSMKTFADSGHVQHLSKYPTEYNFEVDSFLKKVDFDSDYTHSITCQ